MIILFKNIQKEFFWGFLIANFFLKIKNFILEKLSDFTSGFHR
jgi:hypothetical protein